MPRHAVRKAFFFRLKNEFCTIHLKYALAPTSWSVSLAPGTATAITTHNFILKSSSLAENERHERHCANQFLGVNGTADLGDFHLQLLCLFLAQLIEDQSSGTSPLS
jgi:hypothetical protein